MIYIHWETLAYILWEAVFRLKILNKEMFE